MNYATGRLLTEAPSAIAQYLLSANRLPGAAIAVRKGNRSMARGEPCYLAMNRHPQPHCATAPVPTLRGAGAAPRALASLRSIDPAVLQSFHTSRWGSLKTGGDNGGRPDQIQHERPGLVCNTDISRSGLVWVTSWPGPHPNPREGVRPSPISL